MKMRIKTSDTLTVIRSVILAVLIIALVGTGLELALLGHIEEPAQMIPVGLIVAALMVLTLYAVRRGPRILRLFQVLMALFVVAGVAGIVLHYQSNVEFELELYPAMEGMEFLTKVLTGAIPVLAPGVMIQIGLLGGIYTFRHPVFTGRQKYDNSQSQPHGGSHESL